MLTMGFIHVYDAFPWYVPPLPSHFTDGNFESQRVCYISERQKASSLRAGSSVLGQWLPPSLDVFISPLSTLEDSYTDQSVPL